MNAKRVTKAMLIVSLLILATCIALEQSAIAQTRLGLHVTQEELNIWRQRVISGPYKSAGDAGQYAPGDWDRIVAYKNSFMANPTGSDNIWEGYTGAGCVSANSASPRYTAQQLLAASFYALLLDDASVRNQVLASLLVQAAKPGTDFSNSSKWCLGFTTRLNDKSPAFEAGHWLTRLLYAYDYIRHKINATDRNTLDTWFINAGEFMRQNAIQSVIDADYGSEANWLSGTLSSSGISWSLNCGGSQGQTHLNGGNDICSIGGRYNNRRAMMVTFFGEVGIMYNDANMKSWSKRFFKEYIKYHVYPDSTLHELNRSHGSNAAHGWGYSIQTFGKMLELADTFARAGDYELYEYTTSEGAGPTAGGSKSLKTVANFFLATSEGELTIYNWNTSETVANLIDGVWYPDNFYAHELWLARGNIYWNDPSVKAAYLIPGPANKQGTTSVRDPDFAYQGAGRAYPGQLFMFGQMEGKVSPYPAGGSQLTTINFAADPVTIASGQSSTLTWSTSNAKSCSASGGWTGTKATSGTQTVAPTQTTTYTLTCAGSNGSPTQSTTVNVFSPGQTGTVAINAGGSSYTAADGTVHEADIFYSGGSSYKTTEVIGNTNAGTLYQTERYGNFSYAIPVANGDYTLTLYFAEIYWNISGKRIFDVIVEGTERISNLDIYAVAGKNTAYDITLPVEVNDGVLNLEFRTDIDNAKLSGLKLTKPSLSPPAPPTGLNVVIRE